MIETAKSFAERHHAGQERKYTGEPYIAHPAAVAEMVASVPHTKEMIAAAWMHDLIEDTEICRVDISILFGNAVADMVEMLTDVSVKADGNRKARKKIDLAHTAKAGPSAKTIKLADLIDNTKSIVGFDPEFAKVYMKEKKALLEVLKDGDETLYSIAKGIVDAYFIRPE